MNIKSVRSSTGKFKGKVTSFCENRKCGIEGCMGQVLRVQWEDGKVSYPCTGGMMPIREGSSIWKIN